MLLYVDCFSGISGDMFLAGLIDLGFSLDALQEVVQQFGLSISIDSQTTNVQGIQARSIQISDSQPLLRHINDINQLINQSQLSPVVKEKSRHVFTLLGEAEAQVHGISIDKVHFHELGAADTLVDIVGVIYGLHHLGIDEVFCSSIPWSDGLIEMQHGAYPGPAPATALLLQGLTCHGVRAGMELVTPTGAALLKGLGCRFDTLPRFTPEKVAYGAGSRRRSDSVPNLLRLVLGERAILNLEPQDIAVLETQIDDMSPEHYSFLCETLQQDPEIMDVYTTPIIMKKGRPAYLLTVLTRPVWVSRVSANIIKLSTSNGIRCSYQSRLIAERFIKTIESP